MTDRAIHPRSNTGPVAHSERRTDLQGMRAIAVLTVFANHLFGWPRGGFVGVDMFFVLSGFFITGILIRERTSTGQLSFKRFYIRRVKRILPSALLVLAVTVIGGYLLFPATRAKDTLLDALYAAIFGANFRFEAVGADYFQSDQPPSPVQHYWSLSIEEQFYFVWPALIVAIFALTRKHRRRGRQSAGHWGMLAGMGAVVAASFGWAIFLTTTDPNAAYFSTFTRVWELGVGALLAIAAPWLATIPSSVRPILAYLGLAGVVASVFLIGGTAGFPAPWAALPVVATALVVASFQGDEVRGMTVLTNPVARWFGDTSYTLYLWHWPVIILLQAVMAKSPLFYALAIGLSLGLTAITYRFYENPIRHSDWLLEKPIVEPVGNRRLRALTPSVWAGIGAVTAASIVVAILGIGYADRIQAARSSAAEDAGAATASPLDQTQKTDACFGAPAMVTTGCALRHSGVPLEPSVDRFSKDAVPGQGDCFRSKGEELKVCTRGYDGADATRIALVGDSHAATLVPALWGVLDRNKTWQLTTYIGYTCNLATPLKTDCAGAMDKIRADLLSKPYDLILVAARREGHGTPENYAQAWRTLADAGKHLAVVLDGPEPSEDSLACLSRVSFGADRTGDCGTSRKDAFKQADPMLTAAQLVPGTTVIDLTKYYCTEDRCPSVIGDVIVYRDINGHLTRTFSSTLAPALSDALRGALAPGKGPDR